MKEEFKPYLKYLVIKRADIPKYLAPSEQVELDKLLAKITDGRIKDGKAIHSYVVVNNNMPYAGKVWKEIANFEKLMDDIKKHEAESRPGR